MAVDPSDRSSLGVLVVGSDAVDLANRVQNLGYTAHTFRKKSEIKGLFKDGTVNVVIHNYDGTGIVGRARRMSLMGRIQMSTNGDFLAHRICSGDFYVSQEMLENDLQRFHAASALSTGLDAKIDDPFFEQLFMFNLAKLKEHLGVRDKAGLLYMLPESMPTHRDVCTTRIILLN